MRVGVGCGQWVEKRADVRDGRIWVGRFEWVGMGGYGGYGGLSLVGLGRYGCGGGWGRGWMGIRMGDSVRGWMNG